ncbi:hypothetical protein D3C84_751080 [compost metagenome]
MPLEAFIAWPTKKPNILPRLASSLARYCSTCSALAASTSSSIDSMAPESVTCLRPFFSMTSSAVVPSPPARASNTILAILPLMVLSLIRRIIPPSCSAETGDCSISRLSLLSRLDSSPITQLAASLASPQTALTASK